jgi:hypothetical protein
MFGLQWVCALVVLLHMRPQSQALVPSEAEVVAGPAQDA